MTAHRALYLLNAGLLTAHEVDAGFWREWDLFGLTGQHGLFVAVHVPLAALALWGYGRLCAETRAGAVASLVVAAAGLAVAAIHGVMLGSGGAEFRTAVSVVIIAATGLAGCPQAVLAVKALRAS